MNMQSRNQYLETIRTEYLKTKSKLDRSQLLNEVTKRTGLDRKYLIKKLRPKSNIDNNQRQRKKEKIRIGGRIKRRHGTDFGVIVK